MLVAQLVFKDNKDFRTEYVWMKIKVVQDNKCKIEDRFYPTKGMIMI